MKQNCTGRYKFPGLYIAVFSLIFLSLFVIQISDNRCSAQDDTLQTLTWAIINTPSNVNNIIAPGSEVNVIAVGTDDRTIYSLDIANSRLYKSFDNGSTWERELSALLINAGALLPVWDIAIAPDNTNMIVAVTSNAISQPREVFISIDGGTNWDNTNLGAPANIGDIAISPLYSDTNRDIMVGTRTGAAGGAVYAMKTPGIGGWVNQIVPPSQGWTAADVIALEFSPDYDTDFGVVAVISTATDTYLNTAIRDPVANSTQWNAIYTPPGVEIVNIGVGGSPGAAQIIIADISLPEDFTATDINYRVYYVSYYDDGATTEGGVYRRNDNEGQFHYLLPDTLTRGISSIAYYGLVGSGKLVAGEVNADNILFISDFWLTLSPTSNPPVWEKATKPPTGGANPVNPLDPPANHRYYANAQVAWSPEGDSIYCGTSSADLDPPPGPTSGWPNGYLMSLPLDESAFSISPYSYDYQLRTELVKKDMESEPGYLWNQTGLIDTRMDHLADVAALQVLADSINDYDILYLASSNLAAPLDPVGTHYFDSIWRSTTRRLGDKWERVRCPLSANDNPLNPDNDIILRVYSGSSYENHSTRSDVLTFAALGTPNIFYSSDEGQSWEALLSANFNIKDMSLGSELSVYAADNNAVRLCAKNDLGWLWGSAYYSGFQSCHTIYALPEAVQEGSDEEDYTRYVFIGDEILGQVAYIDFAEPHPKFKTILAAPMAGDTHVVAHDRFLSNHSIFIAINDFTGTMGKMFRWKLGESTDWTHLVPPDNAFYGVGLEEDVLYGAWRVPSPPNITVGVDRTLYSLYNTPPPLEWDDLTVNLTPAVVFTREPSALVVSSNDYNTLWAIDNQAYNWTTQAGCLWYFIDTLAKKGPKPISPPAGGIIPVDPVSGRSAEINFTWYQLRDAAMYELQLSKDDTFSKQLIVNPTIIPSDQTAPAWILQPGFLEANHTYYWRLRASGSIQGEIIRSPYSATMSFTVGAGLPVNSPYHGPLLLAPDNACGCPCESPVSFTWSPLKDITEYQFEFSENADMSSALVSQEVTTTSFDYEGKLKCNTNYFWRVRANEPFPSEWSATFSFLTQPESVTEEPEKGKTENQPAIPLFAIIIIIVIGVVLFISMLVLIKTKPAFIKSLGNPSKDIRSSIGSGNPVGRIFSRLKKNNYSEKSVRTDDYDSGASETGTPQSTGGFFTKLKDAIIMPLRRRRYLSSSKSNKSKYF
jgi:hypothetical protein